MVLQYFAFVSSLKLSWTRPTAVWHKGLVCRSTSAHQVSLKSSNYCLAGRTILTCYCTFEGSQWLLLLLIMVFRIWAHKNGHIDNKRIICKNLPRRFKEINAEVGTLDIRLSTAPQKWVLNIQLPVLLDVPFFFFLRKRAAFPLITIPNMRPLHTMVTGITLCMEHDW